MLSAEQQCARASESAAAQAFREMFDPPVSHHLPQSMTADEHAAAIRDSLARDRDVSYSIGTTRHRGKAADFAWEYLSNDDETIVLLLEAMRIEAAGASASALAAAFKRFCASAHDRAGAAASSIESRSGIQFRYLPGSQS